MFLTSDKTYKIYRGSLCNINLSLKINWKKGIYQKFVNKRPLGSLQKLIYTTYLHNLSTQPIYTTVETQFNRTQFENNETTI